MAKLVTTDLHLLEVRGVGGGGGGTLTRPSGGLLCLVEICHAAPLASYRHSSIEFCQLDFLRGLCDLSNEVITNSNLATLTHMHGYFLSSTHDTLLVTESLVADVEDASWNLARAWQ